MSHIAPIENKNINSKSNFNAVKIKVNNPKTYIPEESQNNGIYNAVDIEVNNPTVTVIPTRKIYSYPEAKDNNSKVSNPINVNSLPVPPLAYQANLINNNFFNKEFEKIENNKVPQPNVIDIEPSNEVSFQASPKVDISKAEEIKPSIDIKTVVANLSSDNYDQQALQMEEITRTAMVSPDKALDYVAIEVFDELINIAQADVSKLPAPTAEQSENRKKLIINQLVIEDAEKNNEDINNIKLPYTLTKEEAAKAVELSEMEQAERNIEYSLYAIAVLAKVYVDNNEKNTGKIIPLTDLPGISTIVNLLRYSEKSDLKIAAIDSLRYINRKEYSEELNSIFEILTSDQNPYVARAAYAALQQ